MAAKDTDKQIFDVSKPGKTTPDASARPVIVGHKPMLKDPMVTPEEKPAESAPAPTPPSHAEKVIISPTESAPEAEKPEAPASATQDEAKKEPGQAESDDTAVMEAVAEQAVTNKKTADLTEEEKKQQEAIAKLIADKTYFVPIAQTQRQKKTQATAFLLLLLVVVVGAYLAIDAGIVDAGIDLPYEFIK